MSFNKLENFFRQYLLIVAVSTGFTIACFLEYTPLSDPYKAEFIKNSHRVLPTLIFFVLFFSYAKIKIKEMGLRRWHFIALFIQLAVSVLCALWLQANPSSEYFIIVESILVCFIAPTAAGAAAISSKLGGNESSITTYTILSNLLAAVFIPLLFPLFTSSMEGTFTENFSIILNKVFPIIMIPLALALTIKAFFKKLHTFLITRCKDMSFYLWGISLTLVFANAILNFFSSSESNLMLFILSIVSLFCTLFQFLSGKAVGHLEGQRVSSGQALGQKNMVIGLWVSLSFLSPTAAIAPGAYAIFQNAFNAWQLWYRARKDSILKLQGKPPYKE